MEEISFILLTTSVPTDKINLLCSENGGTRATSGSLAADLYL